MNYTGILYSGKTRQNFFRNVWVRSGMNRAPGAHAGSPGPWYPVLCGCIWDSGSVRRRGESLCALGMYTGDQARRCNIYWVAFLSFLKIYTSSAQFVYKSHRTVHLPATRKQHNIYI